MANRKCWLITHGNNGSFLTYEMFKLNEQFNSIDECHFTCDVAVVYTYLHFKERVSQAALTSFLSSLREELGIILFNLFGYDSITSNTHAESLTDHVGFKILVHHYQTGNSTFKACTDGVNGVFRGLIWQHDSIQRIKQVLKSRNKRLGDFLNSMEEELSEYRQKAESVDLMRERLLEYEAIIEQRGEVIRTQKTQLNELWRFQFVCHVLRTRISDLDPETQMMMLAPDHKGRPLFDI